MTEKKYKTILVSKKRNGAVLWLTLNRPEVHNAFNAQTIAELIDIFERIKSDELTRVVVLTGKGKSFCAGADINWMREIIDYSFEQNLDESLQLAEALYKIYTLPKPTIAMVNGAAIGGGTGALCVCDIAVAVGDDVAVRVAVPGSVAVFVAVIVGLGPGVDVSVAVGRTVAVRVEVAATVAVFVAVGLGVQPSGVTVHVAVGGTVPIQQPFTLMLSW